MKHRRGKGQQEHRKHLGIDALVNILAGHAHLLHNLKPGLILIALRNLLVVDNQHGCQQEHNGQNDAKEEDSAEGSVKVIPLLCPAFCTAAIKAGFP